MGLFDFLFGKKKPDPSFTLGVVNFFKGDDNPSYLMVVGFVKGSIKVGDEMVVTKMSCVTETPVKTTVLSLEVPEGEVQEATETIVMARVQDGAKLDIYKGTVLHSENAPDVELYNAYTVALGIAFVDEQEGKLTKEDCEKLAASDISEIWQLYYRVHAEEAKRFEAKQVLLKYKRRELYKLIREKLFLVDDIYVVYSVETDEPYLFSHASEDEKGSLSVTMPMAQLIPSSYIHNLKEMFGKNENFVFKRIENGPDKEGIRNFIRDLFIYDGIRGIQYCGEETTILAEQLVDLPRYKGMDETEIPVTNPNVIKWLYLARQLGKLNTKDKKTLSQVYLYQFYEALKTAKFIAPMRLHGYDQLLEDNPQTEIEPNIPFDLAMQTGKTKELTLQVYTDWKRLRKHRGEDCKGLIVTLDEQLEYYDVVINPGGHPMAAATITEELYNEVKKKTV
ncbi:SseB family protein [uncultured Granulicatella sp.]|uniref:SseB family protein n=1 Tax=uncultured Granulicatella sp. TaxID=316089 RepID=UPI0028D0A729|nr:SseB family protein [uncultured Granulicatella sp.]